MLLRAHEHGILEMGTARGMPLGGGMHEKAWPGGAS